MARTGLKKAAKASNMRLLIFIAITLSIKLLSFGIELNSAKSIGNMSFMSTALWVLSQAVCIAILWQQSRPVFDDDDLLIDCMDITDSTSLGVLSYLIDILAVLWVVEIGTLYSRKFYVLLGIMPVAGVLKLVAKCTPSSTASTLERPPAPQAAPKIQRKVRKGPIRR